MTAPAAPWQPIDTHRGITPAMLRMPDGMEFPAMWFPYCAEAREDPWNWCAMTDRRPACWHDGVCWEGDVGHGLSIKPTHWRPLTVEEAAECAR
jgi:hypothetical protein